MRASLQEDRAFSKVSISNSATHLQRLEEGERPSLEYRQYQCTYYTSRKCLHPSNSGEKRGQVCLYLRQINVTTSPAALLEKIIILSFRALTTVSGLAQGWLQCYFSRVSHSPHHNDLAMLVPSIPAVDGVCQAQLLPVCLEPPWPTTMPLLSP